MGRRDYTELCPNMVTPPPSPVEQEDFQPSSSTSRLILVSNRLPVTITSSGDGRLQYSKSSGGLVTCMSGIGPDQTYSWYGWPGFVKAHHRSRILKDLMRDHGAMPVFLDNDLASKHYSGFSNSVLWPALHYQDTMINFKDCDWQAYQKVNRQFAVEIAFNAVDGDTVWVHDYHFMLLPQMLRREAEKWGKKLVIGFFLHTPFPSGDMFRVIPVWRELLEGLLLCDLVGFHAPSYNVNFKRTCSDLLNITESQTGVSFGKRFVRTGDFPVGVDSKKILHFLQKPEVKTRLTALKEQNSGMQCIIGVDRVDYIKGIPQKLDAFDLFLEEHPEMVGKVTMIQVAIPSRDNILEYRSLAMKIHQQVDEINTKHGTPKYTPIKLLHQSIPFEDLLALYASSDVCLITSIRDGMNLVSYEYIACQQDRHGVLVLSEFAGASERLNGSLLFNPWNKADTANAIYRALTMELGQRVANYQKQEQFVMKNTSALWTETFITELNKIGLNGRSYDNA